ncbi:MAG: GC-type dockerin domain-anchored protein [Phycisphaerales bacterium JB060]
MDCQNTTRVFALAAIAASCPGLAGLAQRACAQGVTIEKVIGEGDVLPNGDRYAGGGLAGLDGDRIAFWVGAVDGGEAICTHNIVTGETIVLAETDATVSPTYGDPFNNLTNATIRGTGVVFPGSSQFLVPSSEWEGLYLVNADGAGGVSVVIDELFPGVRIPGLPAQNDAGVAYTDAGYAGEPVFFTTLGGAITPVATRGMAAPGGGSYFELEPAHAGGDWVAFWGIATGSDIGTLWGAWVWDASTGETTLIAQEGQPMLGAPAGVNYETVSALDTDGQRVLVGGSSGGLPRAFYSALYLWDESTGLQEVVKRGDTMPTGETFGFVSGIAVDGDIVLFRGSDESADVTALYAWVNGEVVEVLRNGQALPGGGEVYNFNLRSRVLSGSRVVMNVSIDTFSQDGIFLATIDRCRADLDGDGALTIFDFLAFQNAFDAGDPAADFDGDGALTIFDFLAFQNAFDAGCE